MAKKQYLAAFVAGLLLVPGDANAQVFYKMADFSGPPLTALDPAFDAPMPGIMPAELDAVFTWNLRSALNLAALQCGFEPLLRTVENYTALLRNHYEELGAAYKSINGYYARTRKPATAAARAYDSFATRMISRYSTVQGQRGFCQTAGDIGLNAKFAPRGTLAQFAKQYLPYLRNAQKPSREQQFFTPYIPKSLTRYPSPEPRCWDDKGLYILSCGWVS